MPEANRKCAMCGKYSGYVKYCSDTCKQYFHRVRVSKGAYRDLSLAFLERGIGGLMIKDSIAVDNLMSFNWIITIAPHTYRLSAQGYRAIELMYGKQLQEAS